MSYTMDLYVCPICKDERPAFKSCMDISGPFCDCEDKLASWNNPTMVNTGRTIELPDVVYMPYGGEN